MNILRAAIICLFIFFVGFSSLFAGDDKILLAKDGYLGGFSKENSKKLSGKITLEIYKPYVDNIVANGLPNINKTKSLSIEYDELWERRDTNNLTKAEIKKYNKDLNIIMVYMKNNQIQACVVKKKLVANPLTGEKFSASEYKITTLETREEVMKHYNTQVMQ